MNQLKKLTWKYFWQQKWKETKEPLIVISSISGVLGFCMLITGRMMDTNIPSIIGLCMMVPVTLIIITFIIKWLKSNWREASERAEEELGKVNEAIAELNQETIL